ncbi:MAG TPA: DUF362 domain-containing protein [Candidatus Acidoferrum sp.]|nr:DUF362 domain-containing protein [Candidatus Acidoferrum sp.]
MADDAATDAYKPVPDKIRALVQRGMTNFTGKADVAASWRTVANTNDIVGIKVYSRPGSQVGTRVAVVEGVIEGLLAARLPPTNIIVWDFRYSDLRRAGFSELAERYGVRVAGSLDTGWDENVFYESALLGQLVFGDREFQDKDEHIGRKSFVTTLLTRQITKIINVSPLLNHNTAGVCGNLYSLAMGSVDNSIRFEGEPGKLAQAVPEIYALPALGDRVALSIVDALICQFQGEQIAHLHYSAALNQLRFSADPVALDILSVEELDRQRARVLPHVSSKTNRIEVFRNAELLELGVAERSRIDVDFAVPLK